MSKKIIVAIFCLTLFFTTIPFASAADPTVTADPSKAGAAAGAPVTIKNPLKGIDNPQQFIGKIISAALGIVGSIALAMFIYGGFTWMTSSGNSQSVEKGKNTLIWAAIGLVIIFTSYSLVKFVLKGIGA
ncbi:MAG: hypothetical protein UT48_C0046G0003 [Parcubacteria group bacterium GW2011_GWE2_39_37]|uniref:Uncharacterized protein n=1 Tax=Candidatus Falkowbacteria bacterium GW2011_GWF2_39_8 TaxID=1618642 RepID=A0A0G0T7V0_9BACT|nr:MAG: hypothetical protein UT48_C0046G0003 [Parcubacteria group bacterium GW2011_GWE2_39_37]KKR33957.1 MAG: hypothetical protein UT64_C0001G0031 [Candidatus Falkowbacteria bacterium GW2011_GWF2_39_8]